MVETTLRVAMLCHTFKAKPVSWQEKKRVRLLPQALVNERLLGKATLLAEH